MRPITGLLSLPAFTLAALAFPASPASPACRLTPTFVVHNIPSYIQPPGADDLIAWTQAAIVSFFPNHTSWETGFNAYMSPQLSATFGLPGADNYGQVYDFTGFRNLYSGLYILLSAKLSSYMLQFVDAVAYPFPNDTVGGLVYSTTLEYGIFVNGTKATPSREAAFAVVKNVGGQRKITEIRKMSNFIID